MWSNLLRERSESAEESGRRHRLDARRSGRPRTGGGRAQPPSPWPSRPGALRAGALAAGPSAVATPWPDPRRLTPRQMGTLSHRLYMAGYLGFTDSQLLSCQPELHPDHATTIARLTGRAAAPDAPRDHLDDWERRLTFALRFAADDVERIGAIRRIVAALQRVAGSAASLSSFRVGE